MSSCCNKRIASNAPSSSHVRNLRHNSCKLHAAAGCGGHLLMMKQFATLRSLQTHLSSCPFAITPCFGGAKAGAATKLSFFAANYNSFSVIFFIYRRSSFLRFSNVFVTSFFAETHFDSRIERAAQHTALRAPRGSVFHQPRTQINQLSFVIACAV